MTRQKHKQRRPHLTIDFVGLCFFAEPPDNGENEGCQKVILPNPSESCLGYCRHDPLLGFDGASDYVADFEEYSVSMSPGFDPQETRVCDPPTHAQASLQKCYMRIGSRYQTSSVWDNRGLSQVLSSADVHGTSKLRNDLLPPDACPHPLVSSVVLLPPGRLYALCMSEDFDVAPLCDPYSPSKRLSFATVVRYEFFGAPADDWVEVELLPFTGTPRRLRLSRYDGETETYFTPHLTVSNLCPEVGPPPQGVDLDVAAYVDILDVRENIEERNVLWPTGGLRPGVSACPPLVG